MSLLNRPTGEVSISATDLKASAVPRICVRSGRPATQTFAVQFHNTPGGAMDALIPWRRESKQFVRGRLPFRFGWMYAIALGRLLAILSMVGICYVVFRLTSSSSADLVTVLILIASLVVMQMWTAGHSLLEPTGDIHSDTSGAVYVRMRGVHPNFVAALEASRAHAVGPGRPILTPDGRWWWDGAQLLPVSGTASQARDQGQAVAVWTVVVLFWVVIGVAAWLLFH